MVLFNYSTKELTAKVVYYGPGLCGKTTNLQWIHEKLPIKNKGKMVSLATEADRTLFFDFLPIELGTIRGMKTRVQLYTVPGQVFYNATRRMVLKGADCVVFVCDSQEPMIDANLDALANLRENLEANEIDADEIPTVLQYNKRDLPNALPVEVLNERLNPKGWPHYEACAKQGRGVEETLKGVTGLVFRSLATKYGGGEAAAAAKAAKAAAPPPAIVFPPQKPVPPPPPKPAAAPAPPRRAAAPLAGGSAEDLLDSLDLLSGPEPAPEDIALPAAEELSLDGGPTIPPQPGPLAGLEADPDTMPELVALEEAPAPEPNLDLDLDAPPPAAPPPPPARTRPAASARPAAPELDLEELSAEPAPADTGIDFELPSPAAPPTVSSFAPSSAAVSASREVPVSVQVTVAPGATDVVVPVEISVAQGTTTITLNLRLTLNLKR